MYKSATIKRFVLGFKDTFNPDQLTRLFIKIYFPKIKKPLHTKLVSYMKWNTLLSKVFDKNE